MKLKIINTIILFISIINFSFAGQILQISEEKLKAYVSIKDLTRIHVIGDRIKKVIHKSNEILLDIDERLGQIYIIPNTDQAFSISIITEQGLVQDLEIIPNTKGNGTITLKPKQQNTIDSPSNANKTNIVSKVISLIKKLNQPNFGNDSLSFRSLQHKNLLMEKKETKNFEDIQGTKYIIKNINRKKIKVQESEFKDLKVIAVTIKKNILNPGETTELFIIKEVLSGS